MPRPLRELFIEVTDKCLLNCLHCSTSAGLDRQNEIPLSELKRLVDEGLPLGLDRFSVSGGEPFIYPDIIPLIKYVKNKMLYLTIYTCGIIQNGNKLSSLTDKLLEELSVLKVDRLIFSIHGMSSTHDAVTGTPGSFDLVVESIKKTITAGIRIELHFVPMSRNIQDIPKVIKLANDLGIPCISFLRLVPQGRCATNCDYLLLDKKQLCEIVEMKYLYEEKYPHLHIRLGSPFNCVHPKVPCSAGDHKILISPNGEVFPCEAFKFLRGKREKIYGSALKDLWEKDKLLNKLRILKHQELKDCDDCSWSVTCKGGCPGQRMLYHGNLEEGRDPLCINSGGPWDGRYTC
jgi:radical SAM protein with 4Fe4S-binding SPASM domain